MDTATHMLRTGRRGALLEAQMALRDLRASGERIDLAWSLAWHDVVSRYRGSILGPFWITLSMGVMVLGIGLLWGGLFRVPAHQFVPMVAVGIVFFGMVTMTINEGCETFVQAAGMLSQTSLPIFTFVWRTVLRNLINLGHHIVIVAAVLVWAGLWGHANYLGAALGFVFLVVNVAWASMSVAIISARFRDIPQAVASITQAAAIMTPVYWPADRIPPSYRWVLDFNPFYHVLDAVRAPLLGEAVAPHTYGVLAGMAAGGWALTFWLFARTRRKIVHYL
ncbi:MAG TPA: ABC transporter permease [Phenylobacterium sp.]|uniref:ABC transporter permease n=1 Tax=Phenylobacterium sp. TaxID=1871053 RepID=UPI002C5685A7|nr:ABC transporter permease [Phenylobacterium sp.]HSV03916.1 ABC transporter permease [Phenylobacterium sp.]